MEKNCTKGKLGDKVILKENTSKQGRNWCFTENKIDSGLVEKLAKMEDGLKNFRYQKEEGESGNVHWQGYLEFDQPKRLSWLKNTLSSSAHWEVRKGTQAQALLYVTGMDHPEKTGKVLEPWVDGGVWKSEKGKRNDLIALRDACKEGTKDIDILENDELAPLALRYNRAMKWAQSVYRQAETNQFRTVEVTVLFGDSGTGKTRNVFDMFGYNNVFKIRRPNHGALWYDGYEGQEILLMDEFYGDWMKHSELLEILDGYPLRLDVKGSHTWANWNKVYLTSNKHPSEWYSKRGMTKELARRITNVVELTWGAEGEINKTNLMRDQWFNYKTKDIVKNLTVEDDIIVEEIELEDTYAELNKKWTLG